MKNKFEGTAGVLGALVSGVVNGTNVAVIPLDGDNYYRFFDETNNLWIPSPGHNLMLLKNVREYIYGLLENSGHLFLNEAFDILGIPKTKNGQLVGWIYRDGMASDAIYTIHRQINDGSIYLLQFNPQGIILDKI